MESNIVAADCEVMGCDECFLFRQIMFGKLKQSII